MQLMGVDAEGVNGAKGLAVGPDVTVQLKAADKHEPLPVLPTLPG